MNKIFLSRHPAWKVCGCRIPAFGTKTGVGSVIAEGKEVKSWGGQDYILGEGIFADLSIVKDWKANDARNLIFRKTARNFNLGILRLR
jgi:3-oxoacid CoA-transferase subunit A